MGIGAIVSLILTVLTNLPKLIGIVNSIIQLIHAIKNPTDRAQAFQDLKDAYQTAQKTGDTTALNQLHDSLGTVGRAPSLVRE